MWCLPLITVVGFFTLFGAAAVSRFSLRLDYWVRGRKIGYASRVTAVHTGVGVVASVGAVGYAIAPQPATFALAVAWLIPFVGMLLVFERDVWLGRLGARTPIDFVEQFSRRYSMVLIALVLGVATAVPFAVGLVLNSDILLVGWMLVGFALGVSGRTADVTLGSANRGDSPPAPTHAKNVVICMVDSLRRDRMSLYGYERETTPFLNRTCDDAYVFENCIAPGTRSGHSIPSLLTGTYASEHGYGGNIDDLRLLSDEFRDHGYATVGISANPHLTSSRFGDGFDWFVSLRRGKDYLFAAQRLVTKMLVRLGLRHLPSHYFYLDIEFIHEFATGFIADATERDRPFFCYLSYMDIHDPYVRELPNVAAFAGEHGATVERGPWMQERDGNPTHWYDEEIKSWGYDETVRYTDNHIATLFDFLEDKGLRDETVIVVTADHGELLGERGYWGHIDIPFNFLVEVPLLIYPANNDDDNMNAGGETVSRFVSGANLPSLVCDAAGVEPSGEIREQWFDNLRLSDCLDANGAEGYCLVDNASEGISTKGYEHPITGAVENYDTPPETTVRRQRLLVGYNWKLCQINDNLYFYRYGDVFLDDPVPNDEVPDSVQTTMQQRIDEVNVFLANRCDEAESEPYEDVERESVRQQLQDLGYL